MEIEQQKRLIKALAYSAENDLQEAVDLLLDALRPNPATRSNEIIERVRREIFPVNATIANKIAGIKMYRTLTGTELRTAKEWVEATFDEEIRRFNGV